MIRNAFDYPLELNMNHIQLRENYVVIYSEQFKFKHRTIIINKNNITTITTMQ